MKSCFSNNLRILCNRKPSITHVCRAIGINRQQFNKYLSGSVYPSRNNLEKICQFFEVDKETINLEGKEFQYQYNLMVYGQYPIKNRHHDLNILVDSFPNSIESLNQYIGYYYCHFYALGYPGYLARTLVRVYKKDNRFYTTSVAHLWDKNSDSTKRDRFKYRGLMLYLADRIFITEYETPSKTAIFHTILYPRYRSSIDYLSGVTMGTGSLHTHLPRSARVEFRFLGKDVNVKSVIRGCGLFQINNPIISNDIRNRITNEIAADEFMLIAKGE